VPDPHTSLDRQTSGNDKSQLSSDHDRLLTELEASREEILRLRDLLIGKEAELGRAKGQVTELEERFEYYARLASRLRLRRILSAIGRRIEKRRARSG